ncbi:uncharacterized protein FOMMEDRAFT_164896 [Fomitiporia mediterranea MF3/22]|uniref:uncharacterized protein n=1 Tax=Fomitiporia mediterranea (strain MF3/22) TaxID=694068 RepID=UPI0004409BF1|nr:uncharacterized protein FOMMEDRAFT_164896 [Fomitiporia mediterranea MF3/22]EJD08192.1 hypothetical protein FOMMEDRAFT_164896 [Fomitiporia mediterranea MF3/22]
MIRKIKQKSYKSKVEFQDDFELIWSNCFVYNTDDNHPLRMCAKRLREKAIRLLKNVTDRRDRLDPPIPTPTHVPGHGAIHASVQPNGIMVNGNGHGHGHGHHSRKHSATPGPLQSSKVPTVIVKRSGGTTSRPMSIAPPSLPPPRRLSTFADQPAFVRTAMGMSNFASLDRELSLNVDLDLNIEPENQSNNNVAGPSRLPTPVTEKLRQIVVADSIDSGDDYDLDYGMEIMNGEVGDKRKLAVNGDVRPRKRARTRTRSSGGTTASSSFNIHGDGMGVGVDGVDGIDPVELWWEATTTSQLMANALPSMPHPVSSTSSTTLDTAAPSTTQPQLRIRKKKKKRRPSHRHLSSQPAPPKSLLGLINNNIRSLRRVRQLHDKFLALNVLDDAGSTLGGSGGGQFSQFGGGEPMDSGFRSGLGNRNGNGNGNGMMDNPEKDDVLVDDRPWRLRLKSLQRGSSREFGRVEGDRGRGGEGGVRGLDVGEEAAGSCWRWVGRKVLEHSGFQSTSKAALDVFTGVVSEYLFNVGRTLRYLCDKYSQQMSAEEIILHTVFESGITHIRDLERYITDDVVRYGSRLSDLEKKLANAYNEVTVEAALDDDAFFNEDEDEDNELVMGNFADALGVDFFGLGELGIASDLGLQSLTIPKKLLRGKNKQRNAQNGEPPPPYPPPPSFAPLTPHHVDNPSKVIGLLRPIDVQRFNAHSIRTNHAREMGTEEPAPRVLPPVRNTEVGVGVVVLPDDQPPVGRTKSGPLGQVLRPASGVVTKKKAKSGRGGRGGGGGGMRVHGPAGPGAGIPPPPSISQNPSGTRSGSPRKVGS